MKYSIVIPTYNHCDDLLKPCIETLLTHSNLNDIELIISANGCTDNTFEYLGELSEKFTYLGLKNHIKIAWCDDPLGYAGACNAGIKLATTDLIVLLNNDVIILDQIKGQWLTLLEDQFKNPKCGISCVIKGLSEPAGRTFAVFFCVMIHRKVFNKIGLISMDYGVGGGEDTDFCIETENAGFEVCEAVAKTWDNTISMYVGGFPIYHKGEGTMHDPILVPTWNEIFLENSLTLAKKYNPDWYKWRLSNHWERAVFFKNDTVYPREVARYNWAAENIIGNKVFELGCTSGYGIQFFPKHIEYTGLDYDKNIIKAAADQHWDYDATFIHADINKFELSHYDTIIAFEVIEHLDNGLEIVNKLKQHCSRLMITVPMLEPVNKWGPHHKLHMLDESYFPGFKFKYISPLGELLDAPESRGDPENINLMLCLWDKTFELVDPLITTADYIVDQAALQHEHPTAEVSKSTEENKSLPVDKGWLKHTEPQTFAEIFEQNTYGVVPEEIQGNTVIDIGANVGMFALYCVELGAERIISVEAQPTIYQLGLLSYVAQYPSVTPVHNAVYSKDGDTVLIKNHHHGSQVGLEGDPVTTITLSTLLEKYNIKGNNLVLKMDCEGSEFDIIMNIDRNVLRRFKVIYAEVHGDFSRNPEWKDPAVFENKLTEFGFIRVKIIQQFYFPANGGSPIPMPIYVGKWVRI